jgi:hypothetical protein
VHVRVTLVVVLLCSAIAALPDSAAAQAPATVEAVQPEPPQAGTKGRLRAEQRAYIGRQVRVHLTDGTTAHGRLIGETDQGLAIQPSPSDEPTLIPYDRVESIATGMRRWKKIALGFGTAAVAAAIAVGMN